MMAYQAGSSSAGATASKKPSSRDFEVFLNFRGPDSRSTVVSVLHEALDRAGIRVFYDDESIRQGEVIEGELMEAIANSKIYIPIFSKDYASSRWCLRELAEIIKCWRASRRKVSHFVSTALKEEEKTILPIFYDVDVSTDLKLKSEVYKVALLKHENALGKDVVMQWKCALQEAAGIKGRDIQNHGLPGLTKLTVEEVCRKLSTGSDPEKVPDDYVGIDNPIDDIMKLLHLDAADVRFVTIHGMGGVGKTTLARLVFNKISSGFGQKVAFLSNVREKSRRDVGIVDLLKDLILQLLQVDSSFLRDVDDGVKMIKDRLGDKKVFIVLDDLDKNEQLLKLAGKPWWFGMGSRIIITTRDIGIIPKDNDFYLFKMQGMSPDDALKLFSRKVFDSDSPLEEYNEISREVVDTTRGLPLAINIVASLFRCNSRDAWGDILEKLKEVVHEDVRRTLMISYEQLDHHTKEIFLDISCLFIDKEIDDANYYWKARNLYPKQGIMILKNMSLIEIVNGNKLWMHDLLRDLGRNLVDDETKIPGRRSRLWSPEVALDVLLKEKGTGNVVALKLGKLDADCSFNLRQFAGFINLDFLELSGGCFTNGDFKEVFSELRWLSWDDCSAGLRLTPYWLRNVVVLILSENLITEDWDGWDAIRSAPNLKVLECIYCRYLSKSPKFDRARKLERLIFRNCASLREIDGSTGMLNQLTYLEVTNPLIYKERLPDEYLPYQLDDWGPQILPFSIYRLKSLSVLKLKFVNLSELPEVIENLENLIYLCLWCPKLKKLPLSIDRLQLLVELDISFTKITYLPPSMDSLLSLKVFKCENCRLNFVPDNIKKLMGSTWSQFDPTSTERVESLKNK